MVITLNVKIAIKRVSQDHWNVNNIYGLDTRIDNIAIVTEMGEKVWAMMKMMTTTITITIPITTMMTK